MGDLLRFVKPLYHQYRTNRRRARELSRMSGSEDARVLALARAIRAVVKKHFDDQETAAFQRIENLRDELATSPNVISFVDYGAGEPDDQFTAEEMSRGRVITRSLAQLCRQTSKKYPWAHLLFKLVREFQPSVCLELGTCLGISAAYQAAAIELNRSGHLITLEGAEPLAALAHRNCATLGLHRVTIRTGRFQDLLGDVLREHAPIDFVFLDGHHDREATQSYVIRMLPFLAERAVLVIDDILWYEGMRQAWRNIIAHPQIRVSVDLGVMGLCVTSGQPGDKQAFDFSI
jgi:predicted O-methyltransferase YrrM